MKVRLASAISLACLLTASMASAQTLVRLDVDLPEMALKVCPNLDAAKAQAALSARHAQESLDAGAGVLTLGKYLHEECSNVPVVAHLERLEDSIAPLQTWTVMFDAASQRTFEVKHDGKSVVIPFGIKQQTVRYYTGRFRYGGVWYQGWLEVPDEPAVLRGLTAR